MQTYKINAHTLAPIEKSFDETTPELVAANDASDLTRAALVLSNDIDLMQLDLDFSTFGAVIVTFPSFGDGRAYSQARILRERFGFQGVIIARGDVLPDQILYMKRCGIDAFETDRNDLQTYKEALLEFSYFYQVTTGSEKAVWAKRSHRESVAA